MTVRNFLSCALLVILFLIIPFTVYITKSYWVLTAKMELLSKHKDKIFNIGLEHNLKFTRELDKLSNDFLKSRFILNGETDDFLINVKKVCKNKTGVNCILSEKGDLVYVNKK